MVPSGTHARSRISPPGSVRVLLFATARTALGTRSILWPVPPDGSTVKQLVAELGRAHPRLAAILAHSRFFREGAPVDHLDEVVRPGEEFAVHPPYGGG